MSSMIENVREINESLEAMHRDVLYINKKLDEIKRMNQSIKIRAEQYAEANRRAEGRVDE